MIPGTGLFSSLRAILNIPWASAILKRFEIISAKNAMPRRDETK